MDEHNHKKEKFRNEDDQSRILTGNKMLVRGMPQTRNRLGFNLADPFAGHIKIKTDLLEGIFSLLINSKTHFQDTSLTIRKALDDLLQNFLEVILHRAKVRVGTVLVLNEFSQGRIISLSKWSAE